MNPGKRFEQKFRESIEPYAYVLRIPDNVYMCGNRLIGSESEADFLVVTGTDSFLVECKATNKKSLQFYNVKEHQETSLMEFDDIGERSHGFLAVEFYDKAGYHKPHRMYLLPIVEWMRYKEESGRKSMPMSAFDELGVRLEYQKGLYAFEGKWFPCRA